MAIRTILITGASSGLGAALAAEFASPATHLVLWGRDTERMDRVAELCRTRGAAVSTASIDLRDIAAMTARLGACDAETPLDLAIFNAGVGGPAPPLPVVEAVDRVIEIITVNFVAAAAGATTVAAGMAFRRHGHIVLIGSIGESFPLPMAPAYSGAKAGLKVLAEAMGLRLRDHGVTVSLISPGFIDTPMSRKIGGWKPFMLTPEAAASAIRKRLARGDTQIVVPRIFGVIRLAFNHLPRVLRHAILRSLRA